MNKLGLVMALCLAGAAQAAPRNEIAVRAQHYSPEQSEDWDSAGGIDLQLRFWRDADVGVALAVGLDSWDAVSETYQEEDAYGFFGMSIHGHASVVPVGLSLLFRPRIGDRLSLVLEGGVRYALVDSGITADVTVEDAYGTDTYRDVIEIDDAFLGVLGANLSIALSESVSFVAGLGYQFNLIKPGESFLGDDLGKTSFEAVVLNAGITVAF